MTSELDRDIAEELSKYLLDVMLQSDPPELPARFAFIESFQTLHANLVSLRDFLFAAAHGDLARQVPLPGFIGGALKTLQANLKHLTWQTTRIASGDFTQRVEFMGEFSEAFNAMVVQLDQTLKELLRKETELRRTNEELLKEITVRRQTEAALRESEEALRLLATTDSLTGLYNRRHFYELAEIEIRRALRYSRPLSVIMFDIDFFKNINDTYGHPIGDIVLTTIANIVKVYTRIPDIIARYGGEEFIIFLPETSAEEAAMIAERLRNQIEQTAIQADDHQISTTVSFGISDHLEKLNSETLEQILSRFISSADHALYVSKHSGRNRVTIFQPNEKLSD